jgi:hypothetical protein
VDVAAREAITTLEPPFDPRRAFARFALGVAAGSDAKYQYQHQHQPLDALGGANKANKGAELSSAARGLGLASLPTHSTPAPTLRGAWRAAGAVLLVRRGAFVTCFG